MVNLFLTKNKQPNFREGPMVNVTLFSQILNLIDRNLFTKTVEKYKTDKHNKGINSWTHLVSMLFCHFSKAQSIREITNGLMSITGNLNHLGIQGKTPKKSSLSYINAQEIGRCSGNFILGCLNTSKSGIFEEKKIQEDKKENIFIGFYNNQCMLKDI